LSFLRKEDDVKETSSALTKEIKEYEAKLAQLEAEYEHAVVHEASHPLSLVLSFYFSLFAWQWYPLVTSDNVNA
jgi:hypothetical protein